MEGFHISALIENDMIFLQGRKYLLLVDTDTVLHLAVYFKVYRIHQFDGRLYGFLVTLCSTGSYSFMVGNAYFVAFFQVGRIDRQEFNPLIDR